MNNTHGIRLAKKGHAVKKISGATTKPSKRKKEDLNPVQLVGIPALLLAAIYSAFGIVLQAYNLLNGRRDLILGLGVNHAPQSQAAANVVLNDDYVPLWLGLCFFIAIFAGIMFVVPRFVTKNQHLSRKLKTLRRLCIALPISGFFAFLIGGYYDYAAIKEFIKTLPAVPLHWSSPSSDSNV